MSASELGFPAAPRPEPALDGYQATVATAVAERSGGHALVVGGPGSGKTTLAVALAVDAVASGRHASERTVVVAPTRRAADALGDRIGASSGLPAGSRRAATPASVGWGILRAAAVIGDRPAPVLITGAEQDDILRRLLLGRAGDPRGGSTWEGIVPEVATALAGFRAELRDLLMRAEESGLGPTELERMGHEHGRPEWIAAARVLGDYEADSALRQTAADQPARYDAAGIVSAAADTLATWRGPGRPSWGLVIVDDAQDLTRAAWDLVRVMARDGAQVVLLGNADESVEGYRGAVPHVVAGACLDSPVGLGARRHVLGGSYRICPGVAEVAAAVAERIGVARGFEARRGEARVAGPREGLGPEVIVSPHATAEARAVAAWLRRIRRGADDVPVRWSDMVVIARSRARAAEARAGLTAVGVPCASVGDALPLHRHPAVGPLLTLARVALGEAWTADRAEEVLTSRLIGLDGPALRRLRRELLAEDRGAGGVRSGAELLVDALSAEERWATLRGPEAKRAAAASAAAAAGRRAAAAPNPTAAGILWAVWARLGLAGAWRSAALTGSSADDDALDAVIALFRSAERHAERLPDAPPRVFLESLEAEDFAPDTLAARAAPRDVVAIETPASAAGREWKVAVVIGLEEGAWPNTRLRDSVLGAAHLADVLSGRAASGTRAGASPEGSPRGEALRAARTAVLDDELRSLYVALTRASDRVIGCALSGEDVRPSRFLSLLGWSPPEEADPDAASVAPDRTPADLRDAVVALRAEAAVLPAGQRDGHVGALARLARAGVDVADPAMWGAALLPSSAEALFPAAGPVRVSPSHVDALEQCPLRSVLQSRGGSAQSSDAQLLGTVLHRAAALNPTGSAEEVDAAVEEAWASLEVPATWVGRRLRQRARTMAEAFAAYAERVAAEGWEVRTEVPFAVEVGHALVSGRADRVHVKGETARIADLKTGATSVTKREAEESGQLAAYQLAVARGGFAGVVEAEGAELVMLAADAKPERRQGRVDIAAVEARIGAVAATLACSSFEARPSRACRTCPVRRACPAVPEGGQVSGA